MSDRRPPELFVEYKSRDAGNIERKRYHHASTAHILAAVRRGVESGTIKGEEVEQCVDHVQDWLGRHTSACRFSPALVIPVDGGEG